MPTRGAPTNALSTRFDDPARTPDGDWRDHADAHEDLPPLRTTVTVEHPRIIITRNRSPDIPFDRSLNAYRGCEHGCVYCFARPTHAFHGLSPGLDFESRLFAKPGAAALLRAEFAKPAYTPAVLAMGTNTDPYQPIEARFRITRAVLALCRETHHPVSITTKSARILDDLPVLASLAADRLAMVMLSITTLEPRLARAMEPRASAPHRRLAALRALSAAGVPTCISISPVIPGLNDHELESLVAAGAAAGATAAVSIPIRLPHEVAPLFEAWLDIHQPNRKAKILNAIRAMRGGKLNDPRFTHRFRPDGEWARLHSARLAAARRRHGLLPRSWDLRTDLFVKPAADPRQPGLFDQFDPHR
ncbi:PA0069 family radical SAM protein [Sandaracinobacteroides saxicola]|uniref:PA0069 family radical SAM protein n=1 Tax=Sandaracinobacteroides saxicola TaxID=2759707 RepID=A0A7G5IEH6_9SPHN|nr:PA0069 family radical SAM protein [Sandaracinobacteroides saxicola]QMW21768.1 PA0069 family radical SAM protein [Sandaracinobacteroides saxicola]